MLERLSPASAGSLGHLANQGDALERGVQGVLAADLDDLVFAANRPV